MTTDPTAPYPPGGPGRQVPVPRVGDAVRFGWAAVQPVWGRAVLLFLGPVLLLLAAVSAMYVPLVVGFVDAARLHQEASAAAPPGTYTGVSYGLSAGAVGWLAGLFVLLALLGAAIQTFGARFGLLLVEGRTPTARDVFRLRGTGRAFATALLVTALGAVGSLLLYLPGLAVLVLGQFAVYLALDRGLRPVAAVREGFRLAGRHLGPTTVMLLATAGVNGVGGLLCGVGAAATYPITFTATAWLYRALAALPPAPAPPPRPSTPPGGGTWPDPYRAP